MKQAKILIADDELEVVRALTMRLRAAGYEVIAAYDGLVATQLAITETPDLVILDIGMPCGDGHTVAQRMLNHTASMSIPIIFLTARTSEADRKKAAAVHAAGYLTKPFKAGELLAIVAQSLSFGKLGGGEAYAISAGH